MGSFVRGVACPRCFKMIYTLERHDGEAEWVHRGSPLEYDERGPFVRCPGCRTPVRHRRCGNVPGFDHEVSQ